MCYCKKCCAAAIKSSNTNKSNTTHKRCAGCHQWLPHECFYKCQANPDNLSTYCKECARNEKYKKLYKITTEDYNILLKKQNGKCKICQTNNGAYRLSVDHCHLTGKIRGILCQNCNHGLGFFKDETYFLTNAIKYLNRQLNIEPNQKNEDNSIKPCHNKRKSWYYKHTYGITLREYTDLLKSQGNCCAICKTNKSKKRELSVDHDHKTGVIRGVLCNNCNAGLGKFKDSIDFLANAILYLENNK